MYGGGNAFKIRQQRFNTKDVREVSLEMSSSEKIIGRWLEKNKCRTAMMLMSKVSSGNSPQNIRTQMTASLENLQTDHLDVYQIHRPDPAAPIDKSLEALTELTEAGYANSIGCSNISKMQLKQALEASDLHGLARFEYVQLPYNLVQRKELMELNAICQREKVRILAYSPLAAGFLTGKYKPGGTIPGSSRFDISPTHQEIYFNTKNFEVVQKLSRFAEELGITMPRLAVAWALSNPGVTSTLIGARKVEHIETALEALRLKNNFSIFHQMNKWF